MKNKIIKRFFDIGRKYRVNRKYKDHLFRLIFHDKTDLLDLYNAINQTNYQNPDDLQITTISDAVYLGMKNDLSFLIANVLNLYEHQSTYNPNMALRGFFYFADVYRAYVEEHSLSLYSQRLVSLPAPVYIVFYNGTAEEPDETTLFLSDAFADIPDGRSPALECRARVLNVNLGHNKVLMERCRRLDDYAYFVACVRSHLEQQQSPKRAIHLAVEQCIQEDRLADILRKNRSEVVNMILTTYDEKLHLKTLREEAFEDGFGDGFKGGQKEHLIMQVKKKLKKGATADEIADALEESPEVIKEIIASIKE